MLIFEICKGALRPLEHHYAFIMQNKTSSPQSLSTWTKITNIHFCPCHSNQFGNRVPSWQYFTHYFLSTVHRSDAYCFLHVSQNFRATKKSVVPYYHSSEISHRPRLRSGFAVAMYMKTLSPEAELPSQAQSGSLEPQLTCRWIELARKFICCFL